MTNRVVKKKIGHQSGDPVLGAKIRAFRQERMRCDQKDFAKLLGVSQAIVSQWENGRYRPSSMALLSIGRLAGDDGGWWAEQAGEWYSAIHETVQEYKKTYTVEKDDNCVIQIHGNAGAGPNRFPPEQADERISLPRAWFKDSQSIAGLRVVGDSMSPLIQDGYLALVDVHDNKDLKGLEGQIVAARDDSGVCIKRLRRVGKEYFLVSENLDGRYPPIAVQPTGYAIVGRVVKWIGNPPALEPKKAGE